MSIDILMPALSPTMEEGTLAKWHVKKGDTVKSGDVIAEIETDKATMEVEAVDEGVVEEILVPEGTEGVKVNAPIAKLSGDDAGASSGARAESRGAPEGRRPKRRPAEAPSTEAPPLQPAPARGRRGSARRRPLTDSASSPRPWPGGSPSRRASTLRR